MGEGVVVGGKIPRVGQLVTLWNEQVHGGPFGAEAEKIGAGATRRAVTRLPLTVWLEDGASGKIVQHYLFLLEVERV